MLEIFRRQMDPQRLNPVFQNIIKKKKKPHTQERKIKDQTKPKHSTYEPLVPLTPVLRLAKELIGMRCACNHFQRFCRVK